MSDSEGDYCLLGEGDGRNLSDCGSALISEASHAGSDDSDNDMVVLRHSSRVSVRQGVNYWGRRAWPCLNGLTKHERSPRLNASQ